jgi:hypothetical protein
VADCGTRALVIVERLDRLLRTLLRSEARLTEESPGQGVTREGEVVLGLVEPA